MMMLNIVLDCRNARSLEQHPLVSTCLRDVLSRRTRIVSKIHIDRRDEYLVCSNFVLMSTEIALADRLHELEAFVLQCILTSERLDSKTKTILIRHQVACYD